MSAGGIVVIGASSGGLTALRILLAGLDETFPWPIAIVQHRGARGAGDPLVAALATTSKLPVVEVRDKDRIVAGSVHVAPADYHLLVEGGCFALSVDPPVVWSRPSIDVLFESAAWALGPLVTAVVLTGANSDGARGAERVRARGGLVLVQDPERSEARIMPDAARPWASCVLSLEEIAPALRELARAGVSGAH